MSPGSRIFIVDDEPVIASSLAAIFQMNGFSARFFTSPLDALAAARLESPDLVVSDVAMPDISGIDLAILMREQHPDCKILLFSGQASTANLLEAARARGHDFRLLLKPAHPSEFLAEIGQLTASEPVFSFGTNSPAKQPVTRSRKSDRGLVSAAK